MSQPSNIPLVDPNAPDPNADLEGLTDDERLVVEAFGKRFAPTPPSTDPSTARAEDMQEPEPPADPSAAPGTDPNPVVEGRVDGDVPASEALETSDPATPDPNASTPPQTAEAEPDGSEAPSGTRDPEATFTLAGTTYTEADLTRATQADAWLSSLNRDQIVAIDALLSGRYILQPAQAATPAQSAAPTPATTPSGSASPASSAAAEPEGEWLDPRAEAEIARLRTEISSLRDSLAPVVETQVTDQQRYINTQIDAAAQSFASQYSLDQPQLDALLTSVAQSGILPSLQQRHGNDTQSALNAAMEMIYWTTPTFRDTHLKAETDARLAQLRETDREATLKQQQLTALSASGGSVPRREPIPTNKADRDRAMIEEIRAGMNGN